MEYPLGEFGSSDQAMAHPKHLSLTSLFFLEGWGGDLKRHPLSLGLLLSSNKDIGVLSTPF